MARQVVGLTVLPGQPTDGSGRVCIHLFVRDQNGPFVEPHVLHQEVGKPMEARPTRGRLACDRKKTVAQNKRGNVITVVLRSDDPRAVTCPRCISTTEYTELMGRIETGS